MASSSGVLEEVSPPSTGSDLEDGSVGGGGGGDPGNAGGGGAADASH